MNRRKFVQMTGGGAAALALSNSSVFGQPTHPNVLFLLMDDMNDWPGHLGGHPQAITPNIDALANSGVQFTNAHVNSTMCIPSRCSMFSSLRPSSTGIYTNAQDWEDYLDDPLWMPINFTQNGYNTYRAGKFFHNPLNDLWTDHAGNNTSSRPPEYPETGMPWSEGFYDFFDFTPIDAPDDTIREGKWANYIIEQLQQTHTQPFFMTLGITSTHYPFYVPRKYFEPFPLDSIILPDLPEDELDDLPDLPVQMYSNLPHHDNLTRQLLRRKAVQAYLATLYFVDTLVGRVLDALESSPYAGDTIVALSSDHALHFGEKRHWRKFALWREDTRVPLILRAPGITQAGGIHTHATELLDLYPTFADLCNLSPIPDVEGVSLRSRLEVPSTPGTRPALITAAYQRHAIVDDRWRYIRYEDDTEELYDHDIDPREHTNLAEDPDHQAIKASLAQWLPDVNVEP